MTERKRIRTDGSRVAKFAKAIAAVRQHPMSAKDLVDSTGCDHTIGKRYLATMHAHGLVYIKRWQPRQGGGGSPLPVYAWRKDSETDAPRPPKTARGMREPAQKPGSLSIPRVPSVFSLGGAL